MKTDIDTDFVYFSGLLPERRPSLFARLKKALTLRGVAYGLLPHTSDIWCRDYMPIQTAAGEFVQFKYDPKYLRTKKYRKTITDTDKVCRAIGIRPVRSDIRLDGGNALISGHRAILTDRIFSENPDYIKERLIDELKRLFRVKKIVIIPQCPHDMTGHADGLVRFAGSLDRGDATVFVSDLSSVMPNYFLKLSRALADGELITLPIPYASPKRYDGIDATGCYINYLQTGGNVFYPMFGGAADPGAEKIFRKFFGAGAIPIEVGDIARDGGVLNCISWNILKKREVN